MHSQFLFNLIDVMLFISLFCYTQQGEQMVQHSVELDRSCGASFSPPRTPHKSPLNRYNERNKGFGRIDRSHNLSDIMTPMEFILHHTGFDDISSAYDFTNCQVC